MQKVKFIDLGLIDYKQAWDYQEKLFNEIIQQKILNRNQTNGSTPLTASNQLPKTKNQKPKTNLVSSSIVENNQQLTTNNQNPTSNYLIFCEHPHVYTLGNSGKPQHLLINEEQLKEKNASFYKINRGGDITYHGPGQIVAYPLLDLDNFFTDIHKYLRFLEEIIILTLAEYNITSGRSKGETGVWLDAHNPLKARKICAMGVRASRWVTMHGLAFNINTDLSYFENIIPCGITDKTVTSLEKEIGQKVNEQEVKLKLKKHFSALFECILIG